MGSPSKHRFKGPFLRGANSVGESTNPMDQSNRFRSTFPGIELGVRVGKRQYSYNKTRMRPESTIEGGQHLRIKALYRILEKGIQYPGGIAIYVLRSCGLFNEATGLDHNLSLHHSTDFTGHSPRKTPIYRYFCDPPPHCNWSHSHKPLILLDFLPEGSEVNFFRNCGTEKYEFMVQLRNSAF